LYLSSLVARATTHEPLPVRTPCDSWGAECGMEQRLYCHIGRVRSARRRSAPSTSYKSIGGILVKDVQIDEAAANITW